MITRRTEPPPPCGAGAGGGGRSDVFLFADNGASERPPSVALARDTSPARGEEQS